MVDDESGSDEVKMMRHTPGAAPTAAREAFQQLLEHSFDMITVVDDAGLCTYASPAVARMSGFDPSEVEGLPADASMHPDDRERVIAEATAQIVGTSEPAPIVFRQLCRDGTFRHVEAQVNRLPAGHPMGSIVINTRDVTERVEAAHAHAESQAVVRMVAEGRPLPEVLDAIAALVERRAPGAALAVMRVDDAGTSLRLAAGPGLHEGFAAAIDGIEIGPDGGSCAAAVWLQTSVLVSDIAADPRWDASRDLALGAGFRSCWSTPIISTGAHRVLGTIALYWRERRLPSTAHVDLMAEAAGLATIALERFRIEGELAYRATHDDLTALPNRTLLADRIERALAANRRHQDGEVVVMFLDLDRFKQVNDELGHAGGDALLVEVAERLRTTLRDADTVARFGGDEFIVLAVTEQVEVMASRINEAMTATFPVGAGVRISCSIGVAIANERDAPDSLIRRADLALYKAKRQGRNCFVVDPPATLSSPQS